MNLFSKTFYGACTTYLEHSLSVRRLEVADTSVSKETLSIPFNIVKTVKMENMDSSHLSPQMNSDLEIYFSQLSS